MWPLDLSCKARWIVWRICGGRQAVSNGPSGDWPDGKAWPLGEVWRRDEIESPCVKICVMHPAEGICVGCMRTLAEIGSWSAMTSDERRAIMMDLPSRAPRLRKRRGGRAGHIAG